MNTQKPLQILALLVIVCLGSAISRETVETGDGNGSWMRTSSRFLFVWQASAEASTRSEVAHSRAVRVTRWDFYGLNMKHTEYHQASR